MYNPIKTKTIMQITNLNKYLIQHQGTANRIKTIFNYHYDAIIREVLQEIPAKDLPFVIDQFIEYMEESLNFPSNDSLEDFIGDFN